MFRALTTLEDIDRLAQFVVYVLVKPKIYDLRTVLIPAVKSIHAALAPDSPGRDSFARLLHHCLAELRGLTAAPIEPPADWARDANLDCNCADCKELARFMSDPTEQVHRFRRRKELRQHLHRQINAHRLDLTHSTERKGSPQTLVCIKTQASYEQRRAQFQEDVQRLKELEDLAGADATRLDSPSDPCRANSKTGSSKDSFARKPRKV